MPPGERVDHGQRRPRCLCQFAQDVAPMHGHNDDSIPDPLQSSVDSALTREALYELVWSEPMLRVAARFGVSSSYMARVCTLLNVPRPGRGYWAKLTVGKAPKQPALPEPRPGDELVWVRDGTQQRRARPLPGPPKEKRRQRRDPSAPRPVRTFGNLAALLAS
jgi:hypothetical protein